MKIEKETAQAFADTQAETKTDNATNISVTDSITAASEKQAEFTGKMQIFTHPDFGQVRTVTIDGEPWLVGKDVAVTLGYANPSEAILEHVDEEDKLNSKTLSSFELNLGQRGGWLINESGLYSLVLSSKLPTAKKFKHWVTSEVLPSIRKHGAYMTPETLEAVLLNPDTIIRLATELKAEQEQRKALETQVALDKPKVVFADAVSAAETSILIGDLAKLLRQNGIEMGQNRLFEWLRSHGYLIRQKGTSYNMPTQRAMEQGLFHIKETAISHSDGHVSITKTPKVSGKGQQYFVNLFLGSNARA